MINIIKCNTFNEQINKLLADINWCLNIYFLSKRYPEEQKIIVNEIMETANNIAYKNIYTENDFRELFNLSMALKLIIYMKLYFDLKYRKPTKSETCESEIIINEALKNILISSKTCSESDEILFVWNRRVQKERIEKILDNNNNTLTIVVYNVRDGIEEIILNDKANIISIDNILRIIINNVQFYNDDKINEFCNYMDKHIENIFGKY